MSLHVRLAGATVAIGAVAAGLLFAAPVPFAPAQAGAPRPFHIVAHRYAFEPGRIEVTEGDLVRIELRTEDIAHSLTIDDYRIAKRVGPGQPVTFEFRAERPGTFPFYCDLKTEEGCRQMRGQLIVRPRP